MRKCGVVIVGSGLIARFHAQAVNESEKLRLLGFCDSYSPESAKRAASEFGGKAWDNLESAFTADGVGMATVATASGAHDEPAFAAARFGVPLLVEKPLAINLERLDAMSSACEKARVPLGCIFQTRWNEEFIAAKKRIAAGELGRITYAGVRIPWWREDDYFSKSSWHGTWKGDGGGSLINQAIHMVDWLVALMPPVVEVKAFASSLAHQVETEDTVSAAIRFEGGALGGIYSTTASYPGRGKTMEITGTRGTIEFSDETTGSARPDALPFDGHMKCFESFVDSLDGGELYPVSASEARKSIALISEIYRSAGIGPGKSEGGDA